MKPEKSDGRHGARSEKDLFDTDGVVEIRRVRGDVEMDELYRFVHDCYVASGYCTPQPDGKLIHYPHLAGIPETTVLVALHRGKIVGTNTWTLDGPAGMHVDRDFPRDVDEIRREGRLLACSYRIATRAGYRNERSIVLGLIRETLNQFVDIGGQTALFSFTPRHERVYQRLLNMTTLAYCPKCHDFDTPLVLMRMDVEKVSREWFRERASGGDNELHRAEASR